MNEIDCPYCHNPNYKEVLPVDKGTESCRQCYRPFDIYPDGSTKKSSLNYIPSHIKVKHQYSEYMCGHNITTGIESE